MIDFETEAAAKAAVDLAGSGVSHRYLTYQEVVRPLLDQKCVSCHMGANPGGGLSLVAEYSATANYPPALWDVLPITFSNYLTFMADKTRVAGHDFSVTYAWTMSSDETIYRQIYADQVASGEPWSGRARSVGSGLPELVPTNSDSWYYLSSGALKTAFGRANESPGASSGSFLIEVLTGRNLDTAKAYVGAQNHVGMLTEAELRSLMAVIDVGMPYMAHCDDKLIRPGPTPVNLGVSPPPTCNSGIFRGQTFRPRLIQM